MKTLNLSDKQARDIYPTAAPELKVILDNTFTKEFFSIKITDRVKSFEDACAVLGIDGRQVYHSGIDDADDIAYKKLKIIIAALNEGWKPDWNNDNEYKYYPWFYLNSPGFRFNDAYYFCTTSGVGSRLCLKSRELAEYAAKQFETIYKDLFTA